MLISHGNEIRLGVIFGGAGPEHEASLSSARALFDHINPRRFKLEYFGIDKLGNWVVGPGAWTQLYEEANKKLLPRAIRETPKDIQAGVHKRSTSLPLSEISDVDCIFPLVHGFGGEDGTLQGLLSFIDKPVVGCSLSPSVQSYKKYTAKTIVESAGISTAKSVFLPRWLSDTEIIRRVASRFDGDWNLVIKPNASGSSFGVTKITSNEELLASVKNARLFDPDVIAEEYIEATELFIGVMSLGDEVIVAPPVVDSPQRRGLYTYFDKYISRKYKNKCPSGFGVDVEAAAKDMAVRIYKELGCDSYARVDIFYTNDNKFYFNELNSPPAFSPDSAFPLGMERIGYPYDQLIETLVINALDRRGNEGHKNVLQIEPAILERSAV